MKRAARYAIAIVALALAVVAAWQVVVTRISDTLADQAPRRALAWDASNPGALLALARQQLKDKHPRQAAATARTLLRTSPLQADGFAVLGKAAASTGDRAAAHRLFAIALARAPRNEYARGWMIGAQLHARQYAAALHNADVLFSFAPQYEPALFPLFAQGADRAPAFAVALGRFLAGGPAWRRGMLDDLLKNGSAAAVDRVFGAVQTDDALTNNEAGGWYARLERDGRWGEAYSRWISRAGIPPERSIPAVYNGSFEQPVTGIGFDWSMRGQPGVEIERTRTPGARGVWAARVTFRERRANTMGFGQMLLLAPGAYTLTFRSRAENVRSDKGLQWDVYCVAGGSPIAESPHLDGSFGWRSVRTGFTVPAANCPAQRLQLVNPGAGGSAQVVSGEIWFDAFTITPAAAGSG